MKKNILIKFLVIFIILFFAVNIYSQKIFAASKYAGTKSAMFLKLAGSPRTMAMGNVYAVIPESINASYSNPAVALLNLKSPEFQFIHTKWLTDINFNYLGYAQTVNEKSGIAIGLLNFDYGSFTGFDAVGNKISDPKAVDRALTFTSSLVLAPKIGIGGTIKYINSNYDGIKADAAAIDAGVIYQSKIEELKFGAVIQNIGTKIKYVKESFSLPQVYKIGAAYSYLEDLLVVGLDIGKSNFSDVFVNLGVEWKCYHNLVVRAGYNSETDIGKGLSTGFGANFEKWQFDYAYLPFGELGGTHRFALIYRFKISSPKKIKF